VLKNEVEFAIVVVHLAMVCFAAKSPMLRFLQAIYIRLIKINKFTIRLIQRESKALQNSCFESNNFSYLSFYFNAGKS
jgi:hypothetical protein